VGLPCPASPPVKPDYVRYGLSAAPWPTPDPAAAPPPLSLSDPLPAAGRNTGYPYGSDGSGRYLLHNGLDMADENDALAGALADGTVIVARDDLDEMFGWRCDWYGELVVIRLDELWNEQPVYVLYGHIRDVQVTEGQRVERGDPVAREGAAGVAVVPHLHLEVRAGRNAFGATQNPLLWVAPWSGSGVIAGRLVDPDGRAWQGVTVTLIDRSGEADFLNTWTYLDDPHHLIRPDASLAENFVFGPVAAGAYDVYAKIQGVEYRQPVEVRDGEISTVEIVTEPYRTPTPEVSPTP
jgi:murein DD-endopeptidase MepM/ murein hydrolase activator NlpD